MNQDTSIRPALPVPAVPRTAPLGIGVPGRADATSPLPGDRLALSPGVARTAAAAPPGPTAEESSGFEALEARLAELGVEKTWLHAEATKHGVPYRMALAMLRKEAQGDPRARSKKGARGLMQLVPATSRAMGVKNPYDPKQNVAGGLKYVGQQLDAFDGDRQLALAAYNAGPGNVRKYDGVPPFRETRDYIRKIEAWMAAPGEDG